MVDIIDTTLSKKILTDLVIVDKATVNAEPTLTKETVEAAVVLLKEVEKNGGYGDIANTIGFDKVTKNQVKSIHQKMMERISVLSKDLQVELI